MINIIGFGFVGQATSIGLKRLGYEITAYDLQPKANIYKEKEFNEIPLIIGGDIPKDGIKIVCIADRLVDGKQDVSHIKKVLEGLESPVILRTTILPNKLKDLKFDYYWPEFLHIRKGIEEFLNPELTVVSGKKDFPFEKDFNVYYCTPEEASNIKYLSNVWNALRISFINEFGDNLLKDGQNMENIIDYFFKGQKYLKWGNGFGGFCLPKDIQGYVGEYDLPLLKAVIEANNKHKADHPELEYNPVY